MYYKLPKFKTTICQMCSLDGRNKKYIQNFGVGIYWKATTAKFGKEMRGNTYLMKICFAYMNYNWLRIRSSGGSLFSGIEPEPSGVYIS
jgi:hypothetical protein